MSHSFKNLTAALLVAGTSIGGGMLVLPIATGIVGFIPSLLVMFLCCIAMSLSGLMLVEASLWFEEGAHLGTITSRILGPVGKVISWILYFYICFVSLAAYTDGGGGQIAQAFKAYVSIEMSKELSTLIFVVIFGSVIVFGNRWIGRINAILFGAMILAYVFLVGIAQAEVKPSLLMWKNWGISWIALPVLLTTFSYQTMVPSLVPYLNRNVGALKKALVGGNLITFVIYALWQMVILGIIPVKGDKGLEEALRTSVVPTRFILDHVDNSWLWAVAEYFAFFAVATSFLGIAMGLMDFLSDGLSIKKKGWGEVKLILLTFVPTLLLVWKFEKVFVFAMETSGGIGDSILNGMIPVLILWKGRYYLGKGGERLVAGGKGLLVIIFTFFLSTLVVEVLSLSGMVTPFYEPFDLIDFPEGIAPQ